MLRILSEEAISGDGNGAKHRVLQNKRRHQVIVPDPQGIQNNDSDNNRLHERKHNPEKGTIRTVAVYSRSLLNIKRYRFDEAME
ncbi:hypothetical protein D3C78_1862960 [compost metagenome]